MPLTPVDIHNMTFKKSALGRRGYDGEQVDALLDAVTLEMIQLREENDALREQARRSDAAVRDVPTHSAAETELSAANDELHRARRANEQAVQIARSLRQRLDQASRAAEATATAAADRSGESADSVLALARRTADQEVHGAHLEADALLLDARERSERITEEARSAAHDIEEDSRRRADDAENELHRRHATLQREADELAEFAENYRTALKDHVRRQAQN
jgi:DivIVA domain-containing protein